MAEYCCRKCQQRAYQQRAAQRLAKAKEHHDQDLPIRGPNRWKSVASALESGCVMVDIAGESILVTGIRRRITRAELLDYARLLAREFMCASCGAGLGTARPATVPEVRIERVRQNRRSAGFRSAVICQRFAPESGSYPPAINGARG